MNHPFRKITDIKKRSDGIRPKINFRDLKNSKTSPPPKQEKYNREEEPIQPIRTVLENKEEIVVKRYAPQKEAIIEQESAVYEEKEALPRPGQKSTFDKLSLLKKPKAFPRSRRQLLIVGGIAVFALIIVLLSAVFNSVTISFKPRLETVELQNMLTAIDTSVSQTLIPQKVIPAERLEFSRKVTLNFPTTGKEYIEDRASGKLKIFNSYSSSPQALIANTRFVTDSGVTYRLVKNILIPGAEIEEGKIIPQYIETTAIADQPGEQSNLAGEINLKIPGFKGTPKYNTFYAIASEGFSGGFKGEAKVVSKDDLKRGQEEVSKAVYNELKDELDKRVPDRFKLLDGLKEIQITKIASPSEKIRAEQFSVEAQATGRILVFREKDMLELVKKLAISDPKKIYVEDSANLNFSIRGVDFSRGRADLTVQGGLKTKNSWSAEEFAQMLKGKKEGSMANFLKNQNEFAEFKISFFPPWLSTASSNPQKIRFMEVK